MDHTVATAALVVDTVIENLILVNVDNGAPQFEIEGVDVVLVGNANAQIGGFYHDGEFYPPEDPEEE